MLNIIFTFYIFIIMSIITKFHIYWLQGGFWPGKDKQDFIDKVLGNGEEVPSLIGYMFVISTFVIMAIFPLAVYYNIDLGIISMYKQYVFLVFAIIFFLRGATMFVSFLAKKATPIFLEYNKKFYAPLCLSLSISYFYLYTLYI